MALLKRAKGIVAAPELTCGGIVLNIRKKPERQTNPLGLLLCSVSLCITFL